MKYIFVLIVGLVMVSCGTKVPYTNEIRDEFGLDSEQKMRQVQFFTSATIILEANKSKGSQGTNNDGALVTNSSKEQERIIIPIGTKCVFEEFGADGIVTVRFEVGVGKTISFKMREGQTSGKYYFVAEWAGKEGGRVNYGNQEYMATTSSGTAYMQVILKKLQKTKRKDRVVKGMKI